MTSERKAALCREIAEVDSKDVICGQCRGTGKRNSHTLTIPSEAIVIPCEFCVDGQLIPAYLTDRDEFYRMLEWLFKHGFDASWDNDSMDAGPDGDFHIYRIEDRNGTTTSGYDEDLDTTVALAYLAGMKQDKEKEDG